MFTKPLVTLFKTTLSMVQNYNVRKKSAKITLSVEKSSRHQQTSVTEHSERRKTNFAFHVSLKDKDGNHNFTSQIQLPVVFVFSEVSLTLPNTKS